MREGETKKEIGKESGDRERKRMTERQRICHHCMDSGLLSGEGPSLVKVIVTVLSHEVWEKHKIHWVYIYSGLRGHVQVPPRGKEFCTG